MATSQSKPKTKQQADDGKDEEDDNDEDDPQQAQEDAFRAMIDKKLGRK